MEESKPELILEIKVYKEKNTGKIIGKLGKNNDIETTFDRNEKFLDFIQEIIKVFHSSIRQELFGKAI